MKHPSQQQLDTFHSGGGTEQFRVAIKKHLRSCSQCASGGSNPVTNHSNSLLGPSRDTAAPLESKASVPELKDYAILSKIGSGGMSDVYLAKHKLTGRKEVVKVILPHLLTRPEVRKRFQREIQSAASLNHPNIVRTLTAFEDDQHLGLVMEYASGTDLGKVVSRSGPIRFDLACQYICEACRALEHAMLHGTVHRDIKPSNLLLVADENGSHVKLLDFGLSKGISSLDTSNEGMTTEGHILGTPDYMSPEQAKNAASVDIRSDIYSLGCTFYTLLCGQPPFQRKTAIETISGHLTQPAVPVSKLNKSVPRELDPIIEKMIAKQPEGRYQIPSEVIADIQRFLREHHKIAKQQSTAAAVGTKSVPTALPHHANTVENVPVRGRFAETMAGRERKRKQNNVWLVAVKSAIPTVILFAAFGLYGEKVQQLLGLIRNATPVESFIVLKGLPNDVDVLIDGRRGDFRRPTANADAQLSAKPGRYLLSLTRNGQVIYKQWANVEAGRDLHLAIDPAALSSPKALVIPGGSARGKSGSPPTAPRSPLLPSLAEVENDLNEARRLIRDREGKAAVELLTPHTTRNTSQREVVNKLLAYAKACDLFVSSVNDFLARPSSGWAFYFGSTPVRTVLMSKNENTFSIAFDEETKSFNSKEFPPELEQCFADMGGVYETEEAGLVKAIGLLTSLQLPNELPNSIKRLKQHIESKGVSLAQIATDLGIETSPIDDDQSAAVTLRNSLTHSESMHFVEKQGSVESLFLLRQPDNQQSLIAVYAQPTRNEFGALIWNLNTGTKVPFAVSDGHLLDCQVSSNGRIFVALSEVQGKCSLRVFTPPVVKPRAQFSDFIGKQSAFDLSADGRVLLRVGVDEKFERVDLQNAKSVLVSRPRNPVASADISHLAINRVANTVASVSGDRQIRIWKAADGVELATTRLESGSEIKAAQFSTDGTVLWVIRNDGLFELLSSKDLAPLAIFYGHCCPITAIGRSSNGKFITTADAQGNVRVWDSSGNSLSLAFTILEDAHQPITSVAVAIPTPYVAVGFADSSVRIWKLSEKP